MLNFTLNQQNISEDKDHADLTQIRNHVIVDIYSFVQLKPQSYCLLLTQK
jgi:hypothetical protein